MEFQVPEIDYFLLAPVIIVALWGIVLMFADLLVGDNERKVTGWLSLGGLVPALLITLAQWNNYGSTFTAPGGHPMVIVDRFSIFLNVILLVGAILSVLISVDSLEKLGINKGEFYMLMLFSLSGMMLMGMANDLILIFLALELLSIPLYIMSAFALPRPDSEESGMKYFLLGAFSSGFLVFGIALIYGATGIGGDPANASTALPVVLATVGNAGIIGLAGVAMMLVGFAFKVGAVPFHMWTPDVYHGAPTTTTAFMSVGSKVAGFAAILRVFVAALPELSDTWVPAFAVIAAITMILGNVVAISQSNIKRMLAYSSIAHAGYLLMGVAAAGINGGDAVSATLYYMLAYLFTNLGAFAVVVAIERKANEGIMLEDYKGLSQRSPLLAFAMVIFMLSLTGIPPTGGFFGKLYLLRSTIDAGLIWLAVVAVLTSIVSAFYYLRVVYHMYFDDGKGELVIPNSLGWAVGVAAVATMVLGILPNTWFTAAQQALITGATMLAGG
jgi:NADH-quinone oxidoreductase subunit N